MVTNLLKYLMGDNLILFLDVEETLAELSKVYSTKEIADMLAKGIELNTVLEVRVKDNKMHQE